jgi:exosortase
MPVSQTVNSPTPASADASRNLVVVAPALAVIALVVGWAYWPAFQVMAHKWLTQAEYSHGWLVPAFAVALLWFRRDHMRSAEFTASWWAIPLVVLAIALKLVAAYFYFEWFDLLSFVPCVAAIVLALGGRGAMVWAWPAVLFLVFMVPLPHTLEQSMREPLRWFGTKAGTYLMQTAGVPAYAEGFIIVVGEQRVGVDEACSGLNMLMTFFALSVAVAIVCERRLWERALIVLSAVPIALIANIARITIVGILHSLGLQWFANTLHDHAYVILMPIALGLLWFELWFLSALFIVEEIRPMSIGLKAPPGLPGSSANAGSQVPAGARG